MLDVDKSIKKEFGVKSFFTVNDLENRKRIELNNQGEEGVDAAIKKAFELMEKEFADGKIWIRVTLWSNKEHMKKNLHSLWPYLKNESFSQEANGLLLYFYLEEFDREAMFSILNAHMRCDFPTSESINAVCYFFSFYNGKLINVYDDRGMDIVGIVRIKK